MAIRWMAMRMTDRSRVYPGTLGRLDWQRTAATDRCPIPHQGRSSRFQEHRKRHHEAVKRERSKMRRTEFTPGERAYVRNQLDMFFSTLPTVAEGFLLKTWRGGPEAGKPKLSPVAKGLLERALMRLDVAQGWPRLFFTEAGLSSNCAR
jgi:hypothetical protein